MKKILFIMILFSFNVFGDVYLKSVTNEPTTTTFVTKPIIITPTCGEHEVYYNTLGICVCEVGYKTSPAGCIEDPCYGDDCGGGGTCQSTLVEERNPFIRIITYHYEASCACDENYIEDGATCVENPCLEKNCYEFDYCKAVDTQTCACREGYVKYEGDFLYNKEDQYYPVGDNLVCIPTREVWDWTTTDKECEKHALVKPRDDGAPPVMSYAYYGNKYDSDVNKPCSNNIPNCSCIDSPFSDTTHLFNAILTGQQTTYTKEKGWVLLYKHFGMPSMTASSEHVEQTEDAIMPMFILYNRYSAEVKAFVYLREIVLPTSYGMLDIQAKTDRGLKVETMLFNNVFSKAFAESGYSSLGESPKSIVGDFSSTTIVPDVPSLNGQEFWYFGDFVASYDRNIGLLTNPQLNFSLLGIDKTILDGTATGEIIQRLSGRTNNGSSNSPDFSVGSLYKTFNTAKSNYESLSKAAEKYIDTPEKEYASGICDEAGKYIPDTNSEILNQDEIDGINFLKSVVPYLGVAYAVFDFFTGSAGQSNPYIFDAKLHIDMIALREDPLESYRLRIPGSISNSNDKTEPFYDKPLGVVSLLTPPVIEYQQYSSCDIQNNTEYCQNNSIQFVHFNNISQFFLSAEKETGCDSVIKRTDGSYFCYYSFNSEDLRYDDYNFYKLKSLPKFEINPDSGLEIVSVKVALVGEVDFSKPIGYNKDVETHWNELRIEGNRGTDKIFKTSYEEITNQETGEIVERISKYSTPLLPYDVANNNLTMVFPKMKGEFNDAPDLGSSIFVKFIFQLRVKDSENVNSSEIYTHIYTYVPEFEMPSDATSNPEDFYASNIQTYKAPIGNVFIKDLSTGKVKTNFKAGDEVEISYESSKNEMDNISPFPTADIVINIVTWYYGVIKPLQPLNGDSSYIGWLENSEITSFNTYDELNSICTSNPEDTFTCGLKDYLENNTDKSYIMRTIKRGFKIPELPAGEYTLYIPVKYNTFNKDEDGYYDSEIKSFTYSTKITIEE